MKSLVRILAALIVLATTPVCFLTKVVSVPMRVTGAVISIVPVAGNPIHDTIDEAAETVDAVPL